MKSILVYIGMHKWLGVGSDAIDYEIGRIPDPDRQLEVGLIAGGFPLHVAIEESERCRALKLESYGFGAMDALHLACAEKAHANVLLTTDDQLLRRAIRNATRLAVVVANPWTWLEEALRQ